MNHPFTYIMPQPNRAGFYRVYSRLFILCVLCMGVASTSVQAQKKSANKYSILLPDEWNKTSKLLSKIIYIIDTHIPELYTKELCFSCSADYAVAFKIGDPKVKQVHFNQYGTTAYTVLYQFYAYMDVTDKSGRIIHRLILNDTNATHSYKGARNAFFGGTALSSNMIDDLRYRRTMDVSTPIALTLLQGGVHEERRKAAMAPDARELWHTVERIIMKFKFPDE